jgi:molybdopterin molybdotransferase
MVESLFFAPDGRSRYLSTSAMEIPSTPADAAERIFALRGMTPVQRCALGDAIGHVLRQEVVADADFPPFDRVMMDGLAVRHGELAGGRREFTVLGLGPAGCGRMPLPGQPGAALEVMTGAVLPEGADCILPCEWYELEGANAVLRADVAVKAGDFIHRRGSDHRTGEILLRPGVRMGPVEVSIAAACGCARIDVSGNLRIMVLGTGDELVAVGDVPREGQIRQTNVPALSAALRLSGHGPVATGAWPDEASALREGLVSSLADHDVVVVTGGVSKGRRDLVPSILGGIGARCILHGVAQRPGKPMGVWQRAGGPVVFGLPGNPVSALVCLRRYVLPALFRWSGGVEDPLPQRVLRGKFAKPRGLTLFLPVVERADGSLSPSPVVNSGDFAGLAGTSGFAEIDESFAEGSPVPYFSWSQP